jgi:hypothetical protein
VRPLRIHTCFFWSGANAFEDFIKPLINGAVEVEYCPTAEQADIVVYSAFDPKVPFPKRRRRLMPVIPPGKYQRVFITGENVWPDMNNCDWAFGFEYEREVNSPRYMRLPLYAWERDRTSGKTLLQQLHETIQDPPEQRARRPDFCAFIQQNRRAMLRRWIFRLLSLYRTVDAPGTVNSNCPPIGPTRSDKLAFLQTRKFAIAFENASQPGYVTEKIVDAFQAGCVPIYWGSSRVAEEFNPSTFIDFHCDEAEVRHSLGLNPNKKLWQPLRFFVQAAALVKLTRRVVDLDKNEAAYRSMLSQPCIADGARAFLDDGPLKRRWQAIAAAARQSKPDEQPR